MCAGALEEAIGRYRAELERVGFVQGLWAKRAGLWSDEPEVQRKIEKRLGWLESPERMVTVVAAAQAIRR